jgi:hypothetical protein
MSKQMTTLTERDQIRLRVGTQVAAELSVMNLEPLHAAAVLASPVITLKHLSTQVLVFARGEADTRSLRPHRLHETSS